MLINWKQEGGGGGAVKKEGPQEDGEGNSHEYQTANELYEILAKSHPFNPNDKTSLTTRDLVILYKNIDIGTKLLSDNNNGFSKRKPNQYVESVVHNDEHDSDGSDLSEVCSNEDVSNVFMINDERINFFNSLTTCDNTLCQKLGNMNMESKLTTEYDKHFLFNDPYIKEQLKSFREISKSKHSDSSVLTTSLLDYICCKRMDDNYNFYMDNVIHYVKHIIEQLTRISNGDYLTDRVKEKWKEVCDDRHSERQISILKTTNSIQLQRDEFKGVKSVWDDMVHSEIDVRSLSKILEKKIVVEVPKLLNGSFKLFTKCYNNRLFIRCKKDKQMTEKKEKKEDSQVDVVLKLKRSGTGDVMSKIDSIMILKTLPAPVLEPDAPKKMVTLQIDNIRSTDEVGEEGINVAEVADGNDTPKENIPAYDGTRREIQKPVSDDPNYETSNFLNESGDGSNTIDFTTYSEKPVAKFSLLCPDEIHCSMQRFNMQLPILEEVEDTSSKRKKSPTKIRIKSPYENKSFVLEERKRKKLLEIREKREKKKMAINDNCKIIKHRYGKGAIMPQSSSSVTKLSITNKSFYNSIYGQTLNTDTKIIKKGKTARDGSLSTLDLQTGEEEVKRGLLTPERNNQKYINRSYYLDDAETEVMYVQMKKNSITEEAQGTSTSSTSHLSNDAPDNLFLFQQFMNHSATEFSGTDTFSSLQPNVIIEEDLKNTNCKEHSHISIKSTNFTVPTNTPKEQNDENDDENIPVSLQCRKSIEKVYNLIKELSSTDTSNAIEKSKSKVDIHDKLGVKISSTVQNSDSGTSIKHQLTSSSPSSFSFDKANVEKSNGEVDTNKTPVVKVEQSISVVPKIIISSKVQTVKIEREKLRKESKRSQPEVPRNPLKAISQLLHEFDHVQKTRYKSGQETKSNRRLETTSDGKTSFRQFRKPPPYQEHPKTNDPVLTKFLTPNEKRARYSPGKEMVKTTFNHSPAEEKGNKKKLTDYIDEVKELNGEAVRGPPKRTSRLNSLAQPKKSYVQAHHEEYQSRYGRNIVSDRLQKLASAPIQERNIGTATYKGRQRRGSETTTATSKLNTGPCLGAKSRRSASSSPDRTGKRSPVLISPSYNYSSVPETAEPIRKKMVAVESYVKSHFGKVSSGREQSEDQIRKSRVPLLPTDFDIASMTSSPAADESTALGKKLHSIIDSMISNPPALTALVECNESSLKLDKDIEGMSAGTSSKCEEIVSCSDYPLDVFEDRNIVTAVESFLNNRDDEIVENEGNNNYENNDVGKFSSKKEIQMLENALYKQLSNGSFQKRLRNKNLTLTPKQSLQQVFVLQSGDSRSLVKTTLSQKIEMAKTDTLSELALLPELSKSCMGWEFSHFPIQIATVGYAFTNIQPVKCTSTPKFKAIAGNFEKCDEYFTTCTSTSTKSLQCSQDNQIQPLEHSKSKMRYSPQHDDDNKKEEMSLGHDVKTISVTQEPHDIDENKKEIDNTEKVKENEKVDSVGYSSSLDILVGLLNEIKKISSCQANMVSLENKLEVDLEKKELEIILNKAAENEAFTDPELRKIVSRTTLQNLEHLGLKSSEYSIVSCRDNIIKVDKRIASSDINLSYFNKTLTVDKEINVNIFEKHWVHRYTDMSQILPRTVNHSTNVTESLIAIISKSSNESMDLFKDCQTFKTTFTENFNSQTLGEYSRKSVYSMTCREQCFEDDEKGAAIRSNDLKSIELVPKQTSDVYKKLKKMLPKDNNTIMTDLDPLLKMKRDILVTVYSILVFTVFAALSFPQFAY
ncbi:hypothetical protein KGM_215406 [Danaus plexippus plexippus]|uniref:Uncharacterized protein n=1 Tax=Danaus plexippus plexippus TaxID=278856 RepID=A0A212EZA0_DANPL|nr:hypothetical protein KGM_215406 [Danaus plexippus plexippus]